MNSSSFFLFPLLSSRTTRETQLFILQFIYNCISIPFVLLHSIHIFTFKHYIQILDLPQLFYYFFKNLILIPIVEHFQMLRGGGVNQHILQLNQFNQLIIIHFIYHMYKNKELKHTIKINTRMPIFYVENPMREKP